MRPADYASPALFTTVYQTSPSVRHAALLLGMSPQAVRRRALYYRGRGVRLKSMPPRPACLNKDAAKGG